VPAGNADPGGYRCPERIGMVGAVVTLRRLSQLVVLSEELNFHRAAERLHLGQPALSRSIRQLEREIGGELVTRTTRRVALTPLGERLVAGTRTALAEIDAIVAGVSAAARGAEGPLRVGFKAGASGRLLTPTVKAFRERHPQIELELRRLEWVDQVEALLEDRVDVSFVWLPEDVSGLQVQELGAEERCIGVARDHPLAGRTSVVLSELAHEPVVTSRSVPDRIARWWSAIPRPDGSTPPLGPAVDSVEEMLEVVAQGRALCFVARSFEAFYGRPDVAFVPVVDLDPAPLALTWRTGDQRPAVVAFREVAARTAAASPGTPERVPASRP
jgi:DNA-binding transcriptional LysR family regulator